PPAPGAQPRECHGGRARMTMGPLDRVTGAPSRLEGRRAERPCEGEAARSIEVYFYDELEPAARDTIHPHLAAGPGCRAALDEMSLIRLALAARPDVSAPPSGEWSGFMTRLDASIARGGEEAADERRILDFPRRHPRLRPWMAPLAAAAALAIIGTSVMTTWHWRTRPLRIAPTVTPSAVQPVLTPATTHDPNPALEALS